MSGNTQMLVDKMKDEWGLRTKLKQAKNAVGRSYDVVILSTGTNDHLKLSGSSMATTAWRDTLVSRLSALADAVRSVKAKCILLGMLEMPRCARCPRLRHGCCRSQAFSLRIALLSYQRTRRAAGRTSRWWPSQISTSALSCVASSFTLTSR